MSLLKSGFGGRSEDKDKPRMCVGHREARDAEGGWAKRRLNVQLEECEPQNMVLLFLLPQGLSSEHRLRCQNTWIHILGLTLTS